MKRRNIVIAGPAAKEVPTVRVLKRSSCPSLSGKSTLVVEWGLDEKTNEVQLRLVANSGGGGFSAEWLRLKDVRAALDKVPTGESITSHVLAPLFRGVSQNMAGFVWAALVHAGFVVPSKEKKRTYERVDSAAFLQELKDLIDGKPAADRKPKPQKPTTSSATKPKKDKPSKIST